MTRIRETGFAGKPCSDISVIYFNTNEIMSKGSEHAGMCQGFPEGFMSVTGVLKGFQGRS